MCTNFLHPRVFNGPQKQAEATEKLREICIRHRYLNGKWSEATAMSYVWLIPHRLINASAERIDNIWSSLASMYSVALASSDSPAFRFPCLWTLVIHTSIPGQSLNLTSRGDTQLPTCHLFVYAKCARQGRSDRGKFSKCLF